jgi:hypothetical protein
MEIMFKSSLDKIFLIALIIKGIKNSWSNMAKSTMILADIDSASS